MTESAEAVGIGDGVAGGGVEDIANCGAAGDGDAAGWGIIDIAKGKLSNNEDSNNYGYK